MTREPPPFEHVRIPTLLVLGDTSYLPYDDLLGPHQEALGDLLDVAVIAAGHTVLWDAFDETAAASSAFWADLLCSSSAADGRRPARGRS